MNPTLTSGPSAIQELLWGFACVLAFGWLGYFLAGAMPAASAQDHLAQDRSVARVMPDRATQHRSEQDRSEQHRSGLSAQRKGNQDAN